MTQELLVLLHCDRHAKEQGIKTGDATTVRVGVDGEERELEMCPPCRKELLDPLWDAVLAFGRRPTAPAEAPAQQGRSPGKHRPSGQSADGRPLYQCPVPGCGEEVTVLRRHVITRHGRDAEREHLPAVGRWACPEKGCKRGQPGQECAGTVGLSVHARNAHGNAMPIADYIRAHRLEPVAVQ